MKESYKTDLKMRSICISFCVLVTLPVLGFYLQKQGFSRSPQTFYSSDGNDSDPNQLIKTGQLEKTLD
jgi:hypothetical protein